MRVPRRDEESRERRGHERRQQPVGSPEILAAENPRDRGPARRDERRQAQPGTRRELGPHCGCSARRRRRSRSGRPLVTFGTRSTTSRGGGDVVYHSSVSASHGSFPARTPLCAKFVRQTLIRKTRVATAITPEPIDETTL